LESNRYNDDNKAALYVYHYPNLMINRYGSWMDTNIVYPNGPDNCIVDFEWYYDTENGDINSQDCIDECIRQSEKVQEEDIWLCERVQKGLRSSAYKGREGRYMPSFEIGEFYFHQRLHKDLEAASEFKRLNKDLEAATENEAHNSMEGGPRFATGMRANVRDGSSANARASPSASARASSSAIASANARVAATRVVYPTIIPSGTPFGASYDRVEPSGW